MESGSSPSFSGPLTCPQGGRGSASSWLPAGAQRGSPGTRPTPDTRKGFTRQGPPTSPATVSYTEERRKG
ncbi:hypothetical protein VULLAG_LOCUS4711 [Vulpes lagopus]